MSDDAAFIERLKTAVFELQIERDKLRSEITKLQAQVVEAERDSAWRVIRAVNDAILGSKGRGDTK